MSKKSIEIDQTFLNKYKDVEVKYPFCYKSKNNKNFFRYLEDGRYEHLYLHEKHSTLSYGTRVDTIDGLMNDDKFFFKVIACRETIIENQEFEEARKEYVENYKKYLEGSKYISREVDVFLKEKERKENEKETETELYNIRVSETKYPVTEQGSVKVNTEMKKIELNKEEENNVNPNNDPNDIIINKNAEPEF